MKLYNLTPLGPGWGVGSRIIEIVAQTISLIFSPVVWVVNRCTAVVERFFR